MNNRASLNAVAGGRAALVAAVLVSALAVAAPAQACARYFVESYVVETIAYEAHIPTCSYVLNLRPGTRAFNKAIRYLDRVGYEGDSYIYRTSGKYPGLCRV